MRGRSAGEPVGRMESPCARGPTGDGWRGGGAGELVIETASAKLNKGGGWRGNDVGKRGGEGCDGSGGAEGEGNLWRYNGNGSADGTGIFVKMEMWSGNRVQKAGRVDGEKRESSHRSGSCCTIMRMCKVQMELGQC